MLTDEQLIHRLERAFERETANLTPPSDLLASIHNELNDGTPGPRDRRWPRVNRGALVGALAVAVTVAVVVLALGVRSQGGSGPSETSGGARSGDVTVRAGDPRGGVPWELRAVSQAGGRLCLRVLRPNEPVSSSGAFCAVLDAHGHAYLNVFERGIAATRATGPGRACRIGPGRTSTQACPLTDFRNLAFGLLGPQTVSITYQAAHGRSVTTPTHGADGAYLVVLPATRSSCTITDGGRRCLGGNGLEPPTVALQSGVITAVTYRDGHVCRLPTPTASGVRAASCPPVGYTPRPTRPYRPAHVSESEVRAPVLAQAITASRYCFSLKPQFAVACEHGVPHGYKPMRGGPSPGAVIDVSFTARLAATNQHSVYEWAMDFTAENPNCPGAGGGMSATTMSPIHAGQHVVLQTFASRCRGHYKGLVTYQPNGWPGHDSLPLTGTSSNIARDGSVVVGRFSVTVR